MKNKEAEAFFSVQKSLSEATAILQSRMSRLSALLT